MWVVSWMKSNSSSVSCIHMLCMCSLLSTSFKFSLCGCMFYTFFMFVALPCAFFRKILLFISKAVTSSSDALQPWPQQDAPAPSLPLRVTPIVQQPPLLLGLHSQSWAPGEPSVLPYPSVRRWWTSCWCLQWCLPPFQICRLLGRMIWIWRQGSSHIIFFWWILSVIHQFFLIDVSINKKSLTTFLPCGVRDECLYLWKQ